MKRFSFWWSVEGRVNIVTYPNSRRKLLAAIFSVTFLTLFIGAHINLFNTMNNHGLQMSYEQQSPDVFAWKNSTLMLFRTDANYSTPQHLSTIPINSPKPHRRLPQALIIGVRKCGTRALLEMLFLHPKIQKAAGEVHFFDRDENYSKGLEWYRKKMPISYIDQVTIEKSPSYFVTPEVPERVRAMNASIKLLLILREPVIRAISDYTQLRSHAMAAATTSTTTASDHQQQSIHYQKTFDQLVLKADGQINVNYRPIMISVYHKFVHQWLDVFPRKQILVVNGDRLIEDPVSEVKRIETFLGLEPKIGRHNFYFNQTKGFYCLRTNESDRCLTESKGRKHPRVDPTVVAKLRTFFVEHNQKLYESIGEDLGWPEN